MLISKEGLGKPLLPVFTTGGLVSGTHGSGWIPLAPLHLLQGSAGMLVSKLGLCVTCDRAVSQFPHPGLLYFSCIDRSSQASGPLP